MQGFHRYILSYVDIVANANNIAYLHYLASRLKTVADAADPGDVRIVILNAPAHTSQILTFCVARVSDYTKSAISRKLSYSTNAKLKAGPLARLEVNSTCHRDFSCPSTSTDSDRCVIMQWSGPPPPI